MTAAQDIVVPGLRRVTRVPVALAACVLASPRLAACAVEADRLCFAPGEAPRTTAAGGLIAETWPTTARATVALAEPLAGEARPLVDGVVGGFAIASVWEALVGHVHPGPRWAALRVGGAPVVAAFCGGRLVALVAPLDTKGVLG